MARSTRTTIFGSEFFSFGKGRLTQTGKHKKPLHSLELQGTFETYFRDPAGTKLEPLPYGFKAISESVCRLST